MNSRFMNGHVLVAALILGLAACGGGGGGGGSGGGGGGGNSPDTTPPTVSISPVGVEKIHSNEMLTVTFSEAMDRNTVSLKGSLVDQSAAADWKSDTTLVLAPESTWIEGVDLALEIEGKDEAGNAMTPFNARYHVIDATAPKITSISPEGGKLGKDAPIVVVFSESMDTTSLLLSKFLGGEMPIATWSKTNESDDTLTLAPATRWPTGMNRDLVLDATDVEGNAITQLKTHYLVPFDLESMQPATVVVGQAEFTSRESVVDNTHLGSLYGNVVVAADGRLFVGDYGNNRVLGYDSIPTENGAAANIVLGQVDFKSNSSATTREGMDGPQAVSASDGGFAVIEYGNNRVLLYDETPSASDATPDVVLGQQDFTSSGTECDAISLANPETGMLAGDKLVVTDSGNNRVLIWNSIPQTSGAAPDLVLGQNALDTCADNDDDQDGVRDAVASARTMTGPAGIWSDGDKLVVVDNGNHRVLLWNSFPTANFTAADIVLGQADFTLTTENDDDGDGITDAPSARTLDGPYDGVWSNGEQLFIVDSNNNRVLVWNTWPKANFTPADVVLGQASFTASQANDADQDGAMDVSPAANTLRFPVGVYGHDDLLFVSDGNDRVLIFRSK